MNTKETKLSVVIHTEEEFNWDSGFFASNNRVSHGKELVQFCEQLLAIGANIVFAMDYAFVSSDEGQNVIRHFKKNHTDNIEFAAHLHPWVNPPFANEDQIQERDSYPGNLPEDIEKTKLSALTDLIELHTGYRPTTYLAGRYGIGKNSHKILKELGYKVDLSITPFTDYGYQEGPDFSKYNNDEVMIEGIRCIPHSTGFISYLPFFTDYLNKTPGNLDRLNNSFLGKVLLRLLGVSKVRLSPEGFNAKEMGLLTESLIRIGVGHLIFSFHSSTVKAGITPYTQDEVSLKTFEQDAFNYLNNVKNLRHKTLSSAKQ
ncbi:hypothetical protein [Alteromonas lipolytica]|uniref:WalW protein n=1 Tax=Alteromonas lipolytica TaxID=1856405 RepID=A0A1E8FE90_9ALTE|nr:hypothetical protein [Alteromonas lipolytica]OFI34076.1 hypothetical protein BFC17_21240 [Alteromonas lipolytica]GGF65624.1 hypothetical protein GCM10011338_17480 [Alteromonas lipolytica]